MGSIPFLAIAFLSTGLPGRPYLDVSPIGIGCGVIGVALLLAALIFRGDCGRSRPTMRAWSRGGVGVAPESRVRTAWNVLQGVLLVLASGVYYFVLLPLILADHSYQPALVEWLVLGLFPLCLGLWRLARPRKDDFWRGAWRSFRESENRPFVERWRGRSRERGSKLGEDRQVSMEPDPFDSPHAERK